MSLGYFDPPETQPFRQTNWSDVNVPSAQGLAHRAAVEGIVLLKNDGILPIDRKIKRVAMVGPWANATVQMQGNYHGIAPFLISPLQGAIDAGYEVTFEFGTAVTGNTTDGFSAAMAAARKADLIIFAGGIDELSIEREGQDRTDIGWPGNQLQLLAELERAGKPIVVLQFGGGQVDDSALKINPKVRSLARLLGTSIRLGLFIDRRNSMGRIPWAKWRNCTVRHPYRKSGTRRTLTCHPVSCRIRQQDSYD